MVAAAVAVERRARFQRVDHEAQTGAARGEEVGFVGAGAAGGGVGHLLWGLVGWGRLGRGRGYLFPDVGLGVRVGLGCRGEGLGGHCVVAVEVEVAFAVGGGDGVWIAMDG